MNRLPALAVAIATLLPGIMDAQQRRLELDPEMLTNEAGFGDPAGLVDEQREIIGPPAGAPTMVWEINSRHNKEYPVSAHLDLKEQKNLASIWVFDTYNTGEVVISSGSPGKWTPVATYGCTAYMKWIEIPLNVTTRYLRITRKTPGAQFSEIAVYEHTPEAHQAMLAKKAEEQRLAVERSTALVKAREEALKRPLLEMEPFGTLSLVDEIDCTATTHQFRTAGGGTSRIVKVLDRHCRILTKTPGEANAVTYRIGRRKLLRPGGTYVLAVEYPEDAPRSMVVINTGNETARGFHTGLALGDALHPKYVNNHNESLDVPLSGRWETWTHLFRLHDRFPQVGLLRGGPPRTVTPEDGFDVTIAQFSAKNIPLSRGAAVATINLYEVLDPDKLVCRTTLPPAGLPHRHLFWREEMSDGVLADKSQNPDEMGVRDRLDWFRHKAAMMQFLGMNTYTKDLLEFGACQHWDPTPLGGNDWVHNNAGTRHLWAEIVSLMGDHGFNILPYYEYSGSKGGKDNLGFQRRARPLTRDDAYTHIKWIETANADVTDPATYDDFRKMLDLTVLKLREEANFAGIWLRPRSQLPVSFSDDALKRFARESRRSDSITRDTIRNDEALYRDYLAWWGTKRRDFLVAMRDHLRNNGVPDAKVLFTGCPGEPGVGFPSWDRTIVTDRPDLWKPVLSRPEHKADDGRITTPITIADVITKDMYLEGLLSPGMNWGTWEVHHAQPADDPQLYANLDGVMLTHAFNRNYTVASPRTMDTYRTRSGLAMIRHYTLNENMMFDKRDEPVLGYFVADIERAGPFCMMAEVLAMANGDPTMIGYLVGSNFGRGFPRYVRDFNANFLALPALPSKVVNEASSHENIVVRSIEAGRHGTWIAVIHTGMRADHVEVLMPKGTITDAVTGRTIRTTNRKLALEMHPMQLRSFRVR